MNESFFVTDLRQQKLESTMWCFCYISWRNKNSENLRQCLHVVNVQICDLKIAALYNLFTIIAGGCQNPHSINEGNKISWSLHIGPLACATNKWLVLVLFTQQSWLESGRSSHWSLLYFRLNYWYSSLFKDGSLGECFFFHSEYISCKIIYSFFAF